MHADNLDAQITRFFNEAHPNIIGQEIAVPIGSPLSVCFPRRNVPALCEFVHSLNIPCLIWVDATVQQQAVRALH